MTLPFDKKTILLGKSVRFGSTNYTFVEITLPLFPRTQHKRNGASALAPGAFCELHCILRLLVEFFALRNIGRDRVAGACQRLCLNIRASAREMWKGQAMQSWIVDTIGAAPHLCDRDEPDLQPGEVKIRVVAAGLNFLDLLMISGACLARPPLPFVPGMEVAGIVKALGPGTTGPLPGTRVLGVCSSGGFAERVCLPAAILADIPADMGFEMAAGLPIACANAHLALNHKARLRPGETLSVTGAAGGVGLAVAEVGKRLGARVIASARGAARLAVAGGGRRG